MSDEAVVTHKLAFIISGGQTGADQAALVAAKELGIRTGGVAPKGYRTNTGPNFELRDIYGLLEHPSRDYPPRTKANVLSSEGTLLFGNHTSGGSKLTMRFCTELHKPCFPIAWNPGDPIPSPDEFLVWLDKHEISVLNVAGNREENYPGIFEATKTFLINALKDRVAQSTVDPVDPPA